MIQKQTDEILNPPEPDDEIKSRGVSQGSPTSPILGNIIMEEWLNSDSFRKIAYADDSIGYSERLIKESVPKDTGLELNEAKCG